MKITVTETIEHSADITAAMIETYLARRGYQCIDRNDEMVTMKRADLDHVSIVTDALDGTIRFMAFIERRKPHEVLYDIARGA